MAKITYDNKVTINPQTSVADINKVTSGDMNEIKNIVNTNDDNVGNISNLNTTDKSSIVNAINEILSTNIIDISDTFTSNYTIRYLKAFYIPKFKIVIITFYVSGMSGSGDLLVLKSSTYNSSSEYYDAFYGVGGTTCYGWVNSTGIRRLVGNSGLISGTTMYTVA